MESHQNTLKWGIIVIIIISILYLISKNKLEFSKYLKNKLSRRKSKKKTDSNYENEENATELQERLGKEVDSLAERINSLKPQ
jgi:uncharacterized protein YxeA